MIGPATSKNFWFNASGKIIIGWIPNNVDNHPARQHVFVGHYNIDYTQITGIFFGFPY